MAGAVPVFPVPDACTLPTAAQPLRLAEFDALFATAVREVARPGPRHLRLSLSGAEGLAATVRDLAARETACCSFFDFQVDSVAAAGGEAVTLDIRVPAGQVTVLDALAHHARAAATGPGR
jgi:hypothetical protein